jgi:hypothetical protein
LGSDRANAGIEALDGILADEVEITDWGTTADINAALPVSNIHETLGGLPGRPNQVVQSKGFWQRGGRDSLHRII